MRKFRHRKIKYFTLGHTEYKPETLALEPGIFSGVHIYNQFLLEDYLDIEKVPFYKENSNEKKDVKSDKKQQYLYA